LFAPEPSRLSALLGARPSDPRPVTILVVDDDLTVGPWVRAALEPVGYAVLDTIDPLEAIRVGKNRPDEIDLLLVDVVMPLMDGRQLAHRMRSLCPRMKILLMSGYGLAGLEETGWSFIAKPFNMEQLAQQAAVTLREEASPPGARHGRR
jgi:two-component system, cell cycle sensor histidine kinase and response regulator CckA